MSDSDEQITLATESGQPTATTVGEQPTATYVEDPITATTTAGSRRIWPSSTGNPVINMDTGKYSETPEVTRTWKTFMDMDNDKAHKVVMFVEPYDSSWSELAKEEMQSMDNSALEAEKGSWVIEEALGVRRGSNKTPALRVTYKRADSGAPSA